MAELNTNQVPNNKTNKMLPILLVTMLVLILVAIVFIGITFTSIYNRDKNTLLSNSSMTFYDNSYDISSKNVDSAENQAMSILNSYSKSNIALLSSSSIEHFSANKLGISIDYSKLKSDMQKITYASDIMSFISQKTHKSSNTINLNNYINFHQKTLENYIKTNISKEHYLAPINAELKLDNGKYTITSSKEGYKVDDDKLYNLMKDQIQNNKFGKIELPLITLKPERVEQAVSTMVPTEELASFSTDYSFSTPQRKNNIGIASSKINDLLLAPNEIFEFYKAIGGKPTKAKGFEEAPVYVNGKVDSGIGGGMCQVSTTLYNTALRANLKMVERYNHALPVHYIPLGLDAAVAYGCNTLRFSNSTDGYLLIRSKHDGKSLTFTIYGSKKLDKIVKVYSIAKSPKEADAYRDVYDMNHKLIKTEHLHKDKYK